MKKNSTIKNPKFSSKYHIEKEIAIIMNKLYVVKQNWKLLKELNSKENIEVICNQFPNLFNIILESLKEKAFLELAKLVVDLDKTETNSITVNDLYNHYQKDKAMFKEKKYFLAREMNSNKRHKCNCYTYNIDDCMKQLKVDLNANKKIINYLKKMRNKSLAHNDKKMTFDTRNKYCKGEITISEIYDFVVKLIKDINEISSSISGKQYLSIHPEIEELNCIRDILKANQKAQLKRKIEYLR